MFEMKSKTCMEPFSWRQCSGGQNTLIPWPSFVVRDTQIITNLNQFMKYLKNNTVLLNMERGDS